MFKANAGEYGGDPDLAFVYLRYGARKAMKEKKYNFAYGTLTTAFKMVGLFAPISQYERNMADDEDENKSESKDV